MSAAPTSTVTLRALRPTDRERIATLTRAVGVFREAEVPVALDVFDGATGFAGRQDTDYEAVGVDVDGELAGWACWGHTPGTDGTFDLYWIVVHPSMQGKGLGGLLLEEMDQRIAGRARLVLIETSGRADYGRTRIFYERHGYRVVATIPDFYEPGDDRVTFAKFLEPR